ncbi:MAG: tail fiber domain-containing protein [Hyphomicrobiaceae bacterium]
MRRLWIALSAALLAMPAAVPIAQDWGTFAMISSTLGVKAHRLCIGEGLRVSDIGCPSYAPSVTTAGDVSVTGNLSANTFIGDGSGLTGLTANQIAGLLGDRIASGTTSILASQNSSLTFITSNTQRLVIGEGGNIGIGTAYPGKPLHIVGAGELLRLQATTGSNNASALLFAAKSAYYSYTQNSVGSWMAGLDGYDDAKFKFGSAGGFADPVLTLTRTGNVGISTSSPNAKLDVFGTVSASYFVGDGSQLTGITALTDRIISGTTRMVVVSNTGYVSLTQAGTNTGWFDPTRGLVTLGVSATGPISASSAYFYAKVGLGTVTPTARLDVVGTISASDAIQVGTSSLGCGAGISGAIRYNTGNIQYCNGSSWTSLSSNTTAVLEGSGSANHIAYWTDSDTLAYDSGQFYWDASGNRLGIGTSTLSAGAALNVSGGVVIKTGSGANVLLERGSDGLIGTLTVSDTGDKVGLGFYGYTDDYGTPYLRDTMMVYADNGTANLQFTAVSSTGSIRFHTGGYLNATTERMRIASDGKIGVGTVTPSAKLDVMGTISASDAIQVGTSSLTCTTAVSGSIRYSSISSTMEYCNSSAWVSMGPSSSVAAFNVRLSGNQTINGGATGVQINFDTKSFDTNNNFSTGTHIFTPTIPGKYLLTLNLPASTYATCNASSGVTAFIRKNGSNAAYQLSFGNGTIASSSANLTTIVDANGSTDQFDVVVTNYCAGNHIVAGGAGFASFSGFLISGAGAGGVGGGGSTPAGNTDDIQYNSGGSLAADTGIFTYAGGVLSVPTVSATSAVNSGYVSGTQVYAGGLLLGNGSAGTPAARFLVDTNTGLYAVAADILGFSTAGTERLRLSASGVSSSVNFFAPNGSASNPGYNFASDTDNGMFRPTTNEIAFSTGGSESVRIKANGNIGILRNNPVATLDVNGTISASSAIQVGASNMACSNAVSGSIRYSAVSSTVEYCQGTAWVSMGPSDTLVTSAKVRRSSSLSLTSGSWTTVSWNTTDWDNGGMWSAGSPTRLTAPVSGIYLIDGTAAFDSLTSNSRWVRFSVNGNPTAEYCNRTVDAVQGGYHFVNCDVVVKLDANDYVEMLVLQTQGSALNMLSNTRFSAVLLSPQAGGGSGADNLGNHTATQNIVLGSNYLSGDGGNEGLSVDASGKVGIGTTSPLGKLHLVGTGIVEMIISTTTTGSTNSAALKLSRADKANGYASLSFDTAGAQDWTLNVPGGTDDLRLWNYAQGKDSLRFTADGKVGIGTATPSTTFDVNGNIGSQADQYVYSYKGGSSGSVRSGFYLDGTNQTLRLYTASNERMRVDASGNVTIGHTSAAGKLDVRATSSVGIYAESNANGATVYGYNTGANYGMRAYSAASHALYAEAATNGYGLYGRAGSTTGYAGVMGYSNGSTYYGTLGGNNGYGIYCYGNYCGGNVAWSPASDARLKEHVSTLGDAQGLDLIAKLRPVTFHWKDSNLDKARGLQYGFIAQEVEKVIPEVVVKGEASMKVHHADGTVETISDTKAMDYGAVVVPLVKAVQQLKAANDNLVLENATLRNDIDALKRAVYGN